MVCDHRVAEQVSHVEHFSVADLVFKIDERDARAARRGEIDAAVADRAQLRAAALLGVRAIEIVAARDERLIARRRDGQVVQTKVRGALRAAWDLVVGAQDSVAVVMLIVLLGELAASLLVIRNRHADIAVRQRARGARRVLSGGRLGRIHELELVRRAWGRARLRSARDRAE